MTRSSILAVIAFAALGSSCLVSTDASAFRRRFGGHFDFQRPIGPRPAASGPAAGLPAKQPSVAAIRQFHHTRLAASNARTSGDGRHMVKGPGLFAEVMAAVACGGLCATPEPDGTPARQGNGGGAGGAGSAIGKTTGVAISGDGSGVTVIGGKWTGIGAGGDAEDTAFRAIALGLDDDGAWVVRTAPTLATAGAGALRACNEQFGQCTLSEAQVAPTAFGCLVVIQSDDASRVFAAAGDSSDLARVAAAAQIANAGLRGQIVFTGCNS
jgi:hypothetical protein